MCVPYDDSKPFSTAQSTYTLDDDKNSSMNLSFCRSLYSAYSTLQQTLQCLSSMTSSGNVGKDDLFQTDKTMLSALNGSTANSSRVNMPFFVSSPIVSPSLRYFHLPTMLAWNVFAASAGILLLIGLTSSRGFIESTVLSTKVNAFLFMSIDACIKSCSIASYFPTTVPSVSISITMHQTGSSSGFWLWSLYPIADLTAYSSCSRYPPL